MIKKNIKKFINLLGYDIVKTPRIERCFGSKVCLRVEELNTFRKLLPFSKYFLQSKDFFFVQIGANDGVMYDQIFQIVMKYDLPGILLEPIDDYYQKLKENYQNNSNVVIVRKALHPTQKKAIIYRLKKDHPFHEAYNGIASFNLNHLLKWKDPRKTPQKWLIPNIDDYIILEEVECITFDTLLLDYGVKKIDLLQIDTEGFDFEILKMINFNRIKPSIVRYEVEHLKKEDFIKSIKLLKMNQYKFIDQGVDIIASCIEL